MMPSLCYCIPITIIIVRGGGDVALSCCHHHHPTLAILAKMVVGGEDHVAITLSRVGNGDYCGEEVVAIEATQGQRTKNQHTHEL